MSKTIKIAILLLLAGSIAALAGYFYVTRSASPPPPSEKLPVPEAKETPEKEEVKEEQKSEPQEGAELPNGNGLLEITAAALGSGEPLTFDFLTTVKVNNQVQDNNALVEGNIILGKDNKGVLHLKNEQTEIKLYSDGDTAVTYLPRDNHYLKMPALATRREMIATMMTGILELPAGWIADMLEGKTPVLSQWAVSSGNHDGTPCWELDGETREYVVKLCLSKEEPHTPLLLSMDLKRSALNQYRVPPQTSITVVTELKNWQLWYALPNDTFAFAPPPDAVEIKPDAMRGAAPLQEGAKAPEFSLDKLDGGTVNLKEYIGKNIIILDFWATWCGPCRQVIPMVAEVAEHFKKEGVILFTVNQREAPEKIKAFLDSQNLSVTVLLDKTGQAGMQYQVTGIPKVILIDKDGLINKIYGGMAPNMKELMMERIQSLL